MIDTLFRDNLISYFLLKRDIITETLYRNALKSKNPMCSKIHGVGCIFAC
jgi:hypothetical protein